jgi:hypothetical protein
MRVALLSLFCRKDHVSGGGITRIAYTTAEGGRNGNLPSTNIPLSALMSCGGESASSSDGFCIDATDYECHHPVGSGKEQLVPDSACLVEVLAQVVASLRIQSSTGLLFVGFNCRSHLDLDARLDVTTSPSSEPSEYGSRVHIF